MKMLLEFTFTAEVETQSSMSQSETKAKARELMIAKLPPNIKGRKVVIGDKHDKISVSVKRDVLTVRTIDVVDGKFDNKRSDKK